jgi:hypothetical protein
MNSEMLHGTLLKERSFIEWTIECLLRNRVNDFIGFRSTSTALITTTRKQKMQEIPIAEINGSETPPNDTMTYDERRRNEIFMKESIPDWIAVCGYIILAAISSVEIPHMFPDIMRWYYVLIAYVFAPFLAFCNAYGTGLTDQNMAYNYSKVSLFLLAT